MKIVTTDTAPTPLANRIERCRSWLATNTKFLSIRQIAIAAEMDTSHLSKIIKQENGCVSIQEEKLLQLEATISAICGGW